MRLLQLLTLQEAIVPELQWPKTRASEPTDIAVHTWWVQVCSTHALDYWTLLQFLSLYIEIMEIESSLVLE